MSTKVTATIRHVFVDGLRNAHAVEHQALALIDRQLDRLTNYPEVKAQLRLHRLETEQQIVRLDNILGELGESRSAVKDVALSISGNMAALVHTLASDEILKNSFANFAFEHFEIASYNALLTLAEDEFSNFAGPLRETLQEEHRMAEWLEANQPQVVRQCIALRADGAQASH